MATASSRWKNCDTLLFSSASQTELSRRKGRFDKAGCRRKIARKAKGTESAAKRRQFQPGSEAIFRLSGPHPHVLAQVGQLEIKGRVVGEYAHGVVIHAHAALHAFHYDGAFPVCDVPVQGARGICSLNGMLMIWVCSSKARTSSTQAHFPSTHSGSSKGDTLALSSLSCAE